MMAGYGSIESAGATRFLAYDAIRSNGSCSQEASVRISMIDDGAAQTRSATISSSSSSSRRSGSRYSSVYIPSICISIFVVSLDLQRYINIEFMDTDGKFEFMSGSKPSPSWLATVYLLGMSIAMPQVSRCTSRARSCASAAALITFLFGTLYTHLAQSIFEVSLATALRGAGAGMLMTTAVTACLEYQCGQFYYVPMVAHVASAMCISIMSDLAAMFLLCISVVYWNGVVISCSGGAGDKTTTRPARSRYDLTGTVMLLLANVTLIAATARGEDDLTDPFALVTLGADLSLLFIFGVYERFSCSSPFLDKRLWTHWTVAAACLISLTSNAAPHLAVVVWDLDVLGRSIGNAVGILLTLMVLVTLLSDMPLRDTATIVCTIHIFQCLGSLYGHTIASMIFDSEYFVD